MKSDKMDIADLLSDESFLNYCKKSSPEDVAFWETYIKENPDRRLLVEYANEKFVQLFNALAEADRDEQETRLKTRLNFMESTPIVQMEGFEMKKSGNILPILLKLTAAAAVLLTAVLFTVNYFNIGQKKHLKTFLAVYGERKNIQLPDGSDITLNAGSKIEINESFGVSNRDVYLEGEAFFDVKHNAKIPFIVHTHAMDVKAMGTAFNVKAYLNEKITETSLIRGLVEVTLKESNNRIMFLYPNQKIKWEFPPEKAVNNNSATLKNVDTSNTTDGLLKKLVITDNGDIKEIAWKENKLIFDNELLGDIAISLERWYGAKIEFKDDAIRNYRYTGTFEKEDLNTVLDFLKESRSFNYKIEQSGTLTVKLSE
ncbi:MAG: FecR domain-containing protein [Ferruginibacter sp.]